MERGSSFITKDVKATIMKMFSWMTDQRIGQMILPVGVFFLFFDKHARFQFGERVICSLFALNAADFSILFNDFNPDYRDWAFRILQSHGHEQRSYESPSASDVAVKATICSTAAQIENYVSTRALELKSEMEQFSSASSQHQSLCTPAELASSVPNAEELVLRDNHDIMNLNESFDRLKVSHVFETVKKNIFNFF